jgi:hypothetical protein
VESHDIRCKMVVFPAFALPIMRIRNLISFETGGRIVSLLLVDDLDLTCPILRRCEKETCKEVEHVCGSWECGVRPSLCTPVLRSIPEKELILSYFDLSFLF